jgi:hypothetical protein
MAATLMILQTNLCAGVDNQALTAGVRVPSKRSTSPQEPGYRALIPNRFSINRLYLETMKQVVCRYGLGLQVNIDPECEEMQ